MAGEETVRAAGALAARTAEAAPSSTTDNTSVTLFSTVFVPPNNQIRQLDLEVPSENSNDRYRFG